MTSEQHTGPTPEAHEATAERTAHAATDTPVEVKDTSPALAFAGAWEYAPAPERTPVEIAPAYGHFISGDFTAPPGEEARVMETINPATEEVLSRVAKGSAEDVDKAVRAARAAFPAWAGLSGKERGKFLYRIARRIQERSRELAVLETMDGGKPIKESRDADLPLVAQSFFYHAGWADKLAYAFPGWGGGGGTGLRPVQGAHEGTGRRPVPPRSVPPPHGVCGQIIPWNFPLLMAAWKLAPALATGNTIVLKPAETTPLTALRLAEIFREVGLPEGVVNIVTGDGDTGAALAQHPGIDKLAFTGSTSVGKQLARIAADRADGLPLTLELGGKSPNIIFADASVDQAIEGIIQAIYFNQGHVCCAGSRLLVEEGIRDEVIAKLGIRMASLRVGDPLDKNTDVGAINSREQLLRIHELLESGKMEGAELHAPHGEGWITSVERDGRSEDTGQRPVPPHQSAPPDKGFWCRPCYFTNVHQSHRIAREEIFGPVLAVQTFRTPEEAIERANNTPYGLSAGVWTDKGSKIFEVASRLKAGVVWLNTFNKFDGASPFGGYKESGFGREGGVHGLRAYVKLA